MGLAPDPSAVPALAAVVATPAFLTEVVMLLVAAALIAYLSHRLGLWRVWSSVPTRWRSSVIRSW